jgi:hypothetical protein
MLMAASVTVFITLSNLNTLLRRKKYAQTLCHALQDYDETTAIKNMKTSQQ